MLVAIIPSSALKSAPFACTRACPRDLGRGWLSWCFRIGTAAGALGGNNHLPAPTDLINCVFTVGQRYAVSVVLARSLLARA